MIYHYKEKAKPLTLLQLNVGRSPAPHEIALTLAHSSHIDIILIQEPYVYRDLSRQITKRHPSYECFTPTDNWTVTGRPRVLVYVRKRTGIRSTQLRPQIEDPELLSDILMLQILTSTGQSALIINIYNAPHGSIRAGEAAKALTSLPENISSQPTILAGDLNLLHERWQPSLDTSPTAFAEQFIEWLDHTDMTLISEIDNPTHNKGNVLDLTLASNSLALSGASAVVATHLDATSDHLPLLITVPWDHIPIESTRKLRFDTLNQPLFLSLLETNLAQVTPSGPIKVNPDLDQLASGLVSTIHNAYKGSARRSMTQGTGQPWWNQDCKKALQEYRTGLSTRKEFRRVVRKTQRQFWSNKLASATHAEEVFGMGKWHKSTGSYRSPPFTDPMCPNSPPIVELQDKRDLLVRCLLQNTSNSGDIPLDSPTVPTASLPLPDISMALVEKATLGAGNTAPGADELPTSILKIAWPLVKGKVLKLFQGCLQLGYHPKCFRHAILAILQKPKKSDYSCPASYRPIALLSVLGKGLERLVAWSMAWIAIRYKVLASQQFGALPLRSAVDLTTCLTHDIEQALNKGLTASLLTWDIKGAFDGVLPGRLILRLRSQGWPTTLCNWIASFATGRSVQVRLDNELGPHTDLSCGLPQGSPVSGILFMLYIAPLFHMGNLKSRFGYADDAAVLAVSPSLVTNSATLSATLQEALTWGAAEGVTFAPNKYELIHFSRKNADQDPSTTPTILAGPVTVCEGTTRPYLRWLGVLFDKKLTFKWHVKEMASKAFIVASALRSLGNTVRGVQPHLLQQVASACVLRKAYYGAETWWPGCTRPRPGSGPGPQISNRVGTHLQKLSKAVLAGARAILPAYRTIPLPVLYRESGFLLPQLELEQIANSATVRIRRLDAYHPLRTRAEEVTQTGCQTTRFARRVLSLPESEQLDPLLYAPWTAKETRTAAQTRIGAPMGRTKKQAAADYLEFYRTIPPNDIQVYSDGSKLDNNQAGGGYTVSQAGKQLLRASFPFGTGKEVYDAEAEAALAGAKAALMCHTACSATNLWICLDNLEVATRLLSPSVSSSQEVFKEFRLLSVSWAIRKRLPHINRGSIQVRWVPSHTQIPGNEAADLAAKEGASLILSHPPKLSYASLKRQTKALTTQSSLTLWLSTAPKAYQDLDIASTPRRPDELQLPRLLLGHIIAARSGHGDFADYHERFKHENAHLLCQCGARKAPLHFFFCHINKRRHPRPPGPPSEIIPYLLSSKEGLKKLTSWLTKTRFYEDICPRHKRNTC
jgi:ribonuclease HI/exonuclease III